MIRPADLDRAFKTVEAAALRGERCPLNSKNGVVAGLQHGALPALARAGRVRIEVYPHNWRVVEIIAGPHRGRCTARPPNHAWRPYRVIDRKGSHYAYEVWA